MKECVVLVTLPPVNIKVPIAIFHNTKKCNFWKTCSLLHFGSRFQDYIVAFSKIAYYSSFLIKLSYLSLNMSYKDKTECTRECFNGHLFLPVTCLQDQFSATLLRFYNLFDFCMMFSSQHGHCQQFCTPKWPLTAKVMWTDCLLNHLRERLPSLFIAVSSHIRGINMQTIARCYVSKIQAIVFTNGPIG